MRVHIDARSISHPRRGGFKTYIENLVGALLAHDDTTEYVLVYDREYRLPQVAGNERVKEVVVPARAGMLGQGYREQVGIPRLAARASDAIWHFPYNTAPVRGARPYVLTLHDMTAFTHPLSADWSAPARALKDLAMYAYPRFLIPKAVRGASLIITVSEYARSRIIEILDVDPERVVVTPLAPSPVFRPLCEAGRAAAVVAIRQRWGIARPFVLSLASTLLKNPLGVLEAFARLPADVRHAFDIVLVMAHEQVRGVVEARIADLGMARVAHTIVNATPSDLLLLYNTAEALLYPSFTESFPFPTVEAMVCGLPVICSNTTGFPEQVGDAALQVDPGEVDEISAALITVLSSPSVAAEMRSRSIRRANLYTWGRTARTTLGVYEQVTGPPRSGQ